MNLQKLETIDLSMQPCSMTSFPHSSGTHYAIACYEQDPQSQYIGEIIIIKAAGLSTIKTVPAEGGVFRIYYNSESNELYGVTTSGGVIFIDPETFNVTTISHPDRPYFTDADIFDQRIALTDDQGNLHVIDRTTEKSIAQSRGHSLVQCGNLVCPAWSCTWMSSDSICSVGDDGRLCLWDIRADSLQKALTFTSQFDIGMVFAEKKDEHVVAVGDYGENYCYYDLRGGKNEPIRHQKFPGGVWHIDSSLEQSKNLSAAACMQGGVIVFDPTADNFNILSHASGSSLSYGVAIHENLNSSSMIVAEVEFYAKKLNQYSLS